MKKFKKTASVRRAAQLFIKFAEDLSASSKLTKRAYTRGSYRPLPVEAPVAQPYQPNLRPKAVVPRKLPPDLNPYNSKANNWNDLPSKLPIQNNDFKYPTDKRKWTNDPQLQRKMNGDLNVQFDPRLLWDDDDPRWSII